MEKKVAIGLQDFGDLIKRDVFYIDKTYFIKEWWENKDAVTLIARPRRFGKTLTMSMLEHFFSIRYAVALNTFSYFDTGKNPSGAEPERFYHGFVLGLLVEVSGRYLIYSNRESGFGRYDVLLEPLNKEDDGIILEFKVHNPEEEKTLQDTVQAAQKQIEEKKYEQQLMNRGASNIRKYGFAFQGKKVLIG